MYVAIEGCSHGELDVIYDAVMATQENSGIKVDFLICCGDFQSVRNPGDLRCMAVPTKYMKMQSFYKYYKGEKVAPLLTIFIGGNHEASNYLQELPYGGWVAPNIYYLGYGGIVNVGGLRIGGISGIYKGGDYHKGRYEKPPYTDSSIRSVYHVRNLEVFRMKQLDDAAPLDIFMSHDWPRGVTNYGDAEALCRQKKFFREEVESDTLGSRSAQELLLHMKPRFWFSGHLHVKFAALVGHEASRSEDQSTSDPQTKGSTNSTVPSKQQKGEITSYTKFLALDKCLPRRDFLQILDIKQSRRHRYQTGVLNAQSHTPNDKSKFPVFYDIYSETGKVMLYHDVEWLTVLRLTNHLQKITHNSVYMPGPGCPERYQFTPSEADILETLKLMNNDLQITPDMFVQTAPAYDPIKDALVLEHIASQPQPPPNMNPHTSQLCCMLEIVDPIAMMTGNKNLRRDSIMITPKRPPTAADMNVTIDTPKPVRQHVGSSDEDDACSGDIVFEVCISSSPDGSATGVLSPVVRSDTPRRQGVVARKSLQLSAPRNTKPNDLEDAIVDTEVALPMTTDSITSFSPKSTLDSLPNSSPKSEESIPSSLIPSSVEFSESTCDTAPSQQCTDVLSPPQSQSPTTSPKRLITDTDFDATQDSISQEIVDGGISDTAVVKTPPKPSKIRRRNAQMYTGHNSD